MTNTQPKVTIVTVTYNCKEVVERTIQNVLRQTYPNIEYIIIDGASTDGTREIIERYANQLAYWTSEPDHGIYEAMNKGISKATGEWIIFRNAGDYFISPTTIADVFAWYHDNGETFITGGTRTFQHDGYYDYYFSPLKHSLWCHNYISHPATFIRTVVQKNIPYDTELRIAADYKLFCQIRLHHYSYCCYPTIITLFDGESGISSSNRRLAYKEKIVVAKQLGASLHVIKKLKKQYYKMILRSLPLRIFSHVAPLKSLYRKLAFGNRWHKANITDILSDI